MQPRGVWVFYFCPIARLPSVLPHYLTSGPSITIVATAVILLLAVLMINVIWYCTCVQSLLAHIMAARQQSHEEGPRQQCTVANLKLTRSQFCSVCNMSKRCYQCENLRQTDHVTNVVPDFHPVRNQPGSLLMTDFSTSSLILADIDF
jgi:hypothetical protein